MNRILFAFATLSALALAAGCDDRGSGTQNQGTGEAVSSSQVAAGGDTLPPGLVLAEAPAGARDVVTVKKEAREGDAVVLRGRVGGSMSPFVPGRASFQLVDTSLKACGEGTVMDECKTPWDYCCDEPKEVAAHSANVQVVGADGKALKATLQGVAGLKPLSTVTVKGTVAKAAGESGTLVVNATGIHVKG